jgi:hypothetical protein
MNKLEFVTALLACMSAEEDTVIQIEWWPFHDDASAAKARSDLGTMN